MSPEAQREPRDPPTSKIPAAPLTNLDKFVNQILKHLLPPARVLGGVALGKDIRLEIFELGLTRLDAASELAIPASVSFLDERRQPAIGHDGACNLESACERVHAADVSVKEVDRLEALAAHFRIKIHAARGEPTHAKDAQHALRGEVDIGRELVGIPPEKVIACVGVD